jgi:hypothetical protein
LESGGFHSQAQHRLFWIGISATEMINLSPEDGEAKGMEALYRLFRSPTLAVLLILGASRHPDSGLQPLLSALARESNSEENMSSL